MKNHIPTVIHHSRLYYIRVWTVDLRLRTEIMIKYIAFHYPAKD